MACNLIVLLCCAAGCTINMVCGFGFGIFCMMILPFFTGALYSAGIVNIVAILQALYILLRFRKNIIAKALIIPLISYCVVNFFVLRYIGSVESTVLNRSLGAFLILLSAYFFIIADKLKIKGSIRNGVIAGGISGLMNGAFSIGGPPVAVYYSASLDDRKDYIATIQSFFLVSSIYSLVIRVSDGLINKDILVLSVFGAAGMVIGTAAGILIFKRVSEKMLKRLIYVLMAFCGLMMLIRA